MSLLARWSGDRPHWPLTVRSGGKQYPLAQEVEVSASIHLPLDHFDAVDVAFDCARTPGQGETGDDGIAVAVDAGGKSVETGQIILPDGEEVGRCSPTSRSAGYARTGSLTRSSARTFDAVYVLRDV
ncbi:hypothetical protein ACWF9B_00845 [Streptomyces sp. NPDC055089]